VEFRWNGWNLDHATRHGVSTRESESLVRRGPARQIGDNKYRVRGRGAGERFIQVIYLIEPSRSVYVIHARPLTDREKRQYRRRKS
jgi:uncharacterized DUF497 family protein